MYAHGTPESLGDKLAQHSYLMHLAAVASQSQQLYFQDRLLESIGAIGRELFSESPQCIPGFVAYTMNGCDLWGKAARDKFVDCARAPRKCSCR